MAGDVEVGGNGSVHWRVKHPGHDVDSAPPANQKRGEDPTDSSSIGGGGTGAPTGHFRVEVIYGNPSDAAAAKGTIQVQGSSLVFFVKANSAKAGKYSAPPQIKVNW